MKITLNYTVRTAVEEFSVSCELEKGEVLDRVIPLVRKTVVSAMKDSPPMRWVGGDEGDARSPDGADWRG